MNAIEYTWKDLPVTIVGLGRSAVGAACLLQRQGARPFVTDMADEPAQAPWREALEHEGVPYEVGGHSTRAWKNPARVVLSPGVPPKITALEELRERGIEVIGELELASRFAEAPVFGVTGTNGKTTVTELLQHILSVCGYRSCLAGNNHTAFSSVVATGDTPDYYVLEVSSYQLESVVTFAPAIAAVLNLTPDHLGRHGTMKEYGLTKQRIFGQRNRHSEVAVLNADDPLVRELEVPDGTQVCRFSVEAPVHDGLYTDGDTLWVNGVARFNYTAALPGMHNRANILAALSMLHAGGIDLEKCIAALSSFPGVAHRLEALGEYGSRVWYNDSKSTNIDSLRVALESFEEPVTLIAGGQGKGSSYQTLLPLVAERVGNFIAYGEEGPVLAAAFGESTSSTVVSDMASAVQNAQSVTAPGGTVVLSPGCASFDQYANFEARGEHFKALVQSLNAEETRP